MALSRALIIRGGFRARRAARSVRNKRKRTPIQCFSGVPRKRGCVASWQYFGPAFAEARRYALISHIFVRTRISHRKHSQFFFHVSRHEKRGFRYVAAASSASSASMTALSPPMSRITCVGCAAPGGAGVPAGFTHTDARSAASTPPCGGGGAKRRKKRRQSRRAPSASARRRTLSDERSRERRNAVEKTRG